MATADRLVKERPVVAVQKGDPHSFELQLAEAAMIRLAGGFKWRRGGPARRGPRCLARSAWAQRWNRPTDRHGAMSPQWITRSTSRLSSIRTARRAKLHLSVRIADQAENMGGV